MDTDKWIIKAIGKAEVNKANPNSCEREPNEDEVKISRKELEKYYGMLSGYDNIKKANYKAIFDGYNNIIVTKKEYEQLKQKLEQYNNRWK